MVNKEKDIDYDEDYKEYLKLKSSIKGNKHTKVKLNMLEYLKIKNGKNK